MIQDRACDGACCRVAPVRAMRNSTDNLQDCFFRDPALTDRVGGACLALAFPDRVANEMTRKEKIHFKDACLNWPQNATRANQKTFAECCWRFEVGDH